MNRRITIIDPIVKKSDAIRAVGGPDGKVSDLAFFFDLSRQTVSDWGDELPPIYAYRILKVFPWLEQHPGEAA